MATIYQRTQPAAKWLIMLLALVEVGIIILVVFVEQAIVPSLISLIVLTFVFLLFSKLVVIVHDSHIELKFGIGLIKKKIPLQDIQSTEVVKNPFIYGYGIRKIPNGWMYNIAGPHGVELSFKNKKTIFRIGSADPDKLKSVIDNNIT